jgi:serine/threonine protein kinase
MFWTVNYLSPEQTGANPTDNQASDLFSLGVTLFEMLTGQLPEETFEVSKTSEVLENIAMPGGTGELVEKLLARDPQDRPRAGRLVQDLIALEISALRRRRAA